MPLQLFACELATTLGDDVDQPRNLAKSVTVEQWPSACPVACREAAEKWLAEMGVGLPNGRRGML
ncbi:hypothetical protein [Propionibacterium sp.]|uniref:hypothetical protein n=1 Tax=Propionibacterium sp. TaxID=1977903 RepID=UPI0039E90E82